MPSVNGRVTALHLPVSGMGNGLRLPDAFKKRTSRVRPHARRLSSGSSVATPGTKLPIAVRRPKSRWVPQRRNEHIGFDT